MQALSTLLLACGALVIAILQWNTAHRKVIADLFDRRMEVYTGLRSAIARITTSGTSNSEDLFSIDKYVDQAMFLFGQSVRDYVDGIRNDVINFDEHRKLADSRNLTAEERQVYDASRAKCFGKIRSFYTEAPNVFSPYLLLDQKTPLSWRKSRLHLEKVRR